MISKAYFLQPSLGVVLCPKSEVSKSQTLSGMAGNFTWWDEDYGEPYPGLTLFDETSEEV